MHYSIHRCFLLSSCDEVLSEVELFLSCTGHSIVASVKALCSARRRQYWFEAGWHVVIFCNNDLQTTLWVTQRCFILFKRFDDQRLRQWNSLLWDLNSSWPLNDLSHILYWHCNCGKMEGKEKRLNVGRKMMHCLINCCGTIPERSIDYYLKHRCTWPLQKPSNK